MESSPSAVKDDSESSEKTTTLTTTTTTTTTDEERKDETQTSTKESSSDVDSGQFTQSTQSSDESKEAEEKMKESQTLTTTTSNAVLECDGLWAESEDKEEKEDEEGRKKDDGKNEEDSTPTKEKIVIEDHDDYLIYLEDVLKRIHAAFYELYDQKNNKGDESIDTAKTPDEENGKVPDLKHVMPYVRKKILKVIPSVSCGRVSFPYRFVILYSVTLVLHCTLHNNNK